MDERITVLVAAFGSPHGDDQVGWRVATNLQRRAQLPAHVMLLDEGTRLLDELPGCDKLIVVDACRSGAPAGTVTRLEWPDPRVRHRHNRSTHSVGVCSTLELAERLGRIPRVVVIFGVEIAGHEPIGELSPEIMNAIAGLEDEIVREIGEAQHA